MCSNCCCQCGGHRGRNKDTRVLLTLEEIERLNEERLNGIRYVDRISQCGSCIVIRFCKGLDAIR